MAYEAIYTGYIAAFAGGIILTLALVGIAAFAVLKHLWDNR